MGGGGGWRFSILTCTNRPDITNSIVGSACLDLRQKAILQYSYQLLGSQSWSKHNNAINGSRQRPELTLVWERTPTPTWLECRWPPLSCGCYILQKDKTLNLGNVSTTSQILTFSAFNENTNPLLCGTNVNPLTSERPCSSCTGWKRLTFESFIVSGEDKVMRPVSPAGRA